MLLRRVAFSGRASKPFAVLCCTSKRFCNTNNNNNNNDRDKDKKSEDSKKKEDKPAADAPPDTKPPTTENSNDAQPGKTNTNEATLSNQDKKKIDDDKLNKTFDKDNKIPVGFEAYWGSPLRGRLPPKRSEADRIKQAFTMSPEERILVVELSSKARQLKVMRNLSIVTVLLVLVVGYKFYRAKGNLEKDVSKYNAVFVNLPSHLAVFVDEKGNFLGVRNFIDFDAFEKSCDASKDVLIEVFSYYPWIPMLLLGLLPILAVLHTGFNKASGAVGSKMFAKEKSRFNFQREMSVRTRLKDVAGLTEAKHEVVEVIDFLKHPEVYHKLGAKLPKGVLLDGPPGVGKTLLAKAVAGEAMVPFVSCSGSEFEEVYVGVGAQRVRELFKEAHNCKPCVVFVDEIDAFGRQRKTDGGGSSRGTLNAFLSELDGFKDASGIMVLAATNRADILDNALTRSGRFDRKISLDLPSYNDRIAIAKVHLAPLHLDPSSSIQSYAETLAALTPGCSGADIFNVCNEAAIQAARGDETHVGVPHFHKAVERVLVGLEKSAVKYTPHEKERLAYHEAGIVVLNWFLNETDPVIKTTILPRGRHRTGVTQQLPHNVFISTEARLLERIVGKLGGYVAQEHFFKDISTSAANDMQKATNMAMQMVCVYGMNPDKIGHIGYDMDKGDTLQKPFGPEKEDDVDRAVEKIMAECLQRARALLQEHLQHVRVIGGSLLKRETLSAHDLFFLLGRRPTMSKEFLAYLES